MTALRICYVTVLLFMIACGHQPENKQTKKTDDDVATCPPKESDADIPTPEKSNKLAAVHTVTITGMKFEPATINIHAGDQIIWINKDIVDHDVTEQKTKSWSSSPLKSGASWAKVFTESTDYYCNLHQVMKGKIIVE